MVFIGHPKYRMIPVNYKNEMMSISLERALLYWSNQIKIYNMTVSL